MGEDFSRTDELYALEPPTGRDLANFALITTALQTFKAKFIEGRPSIHKTRCPAPIWRHRCGSWHATRGRKKPSVAMIARLFIELSPPLRLAISAPIVHFLFYQQRKPFQGRLAGSHIVSKRYSNEALKDPTNACS
jgi:hypothetical protein